MPSPLLVFCTIMLVNLCLWQIALGRELHMETIIAGPRDECKENEHVETLCQTCAKRTKSNIVYPMCCFGQEEAKEWCDRYTKYGRHPLK
ncbi:uncharacterized protein [Rhodnius prolixus]|uniref:Uncharacterized protein n=1 Tax=Rhodnius prolixus TaxID=13249 RepID=A0A4P6DCG7_RHOPR